MAQVNAFRFEPSIEAEGLRQELTSFVERALAPHVEEGTIQVPLIGPVGFGNPRPVDDITTKLLDLAILHENGRAAELFCSAISKLVVSFREYVMLEGITVDHQVAVFDGVALEMLPRSRSGITPPLDLLPTGIGSSSEDPFCDAVLLREDWTIQPRFAKPSDCRAQQGSHGVFRSRRESKNDPEFDRENFVRAISLAVRRHVHASVFWTYVSPDEITTSHSRGVNGYTRLSGWWPRSAPTEVTNAHVNDAKDLYGHIERLGPKKRDKLIVPIDRLADSFDARNVVDRAIDLGIALECLFLGKEKSELQFRLALRAARFLAEDFSERQEIVEVIKGFYKLRSKAVHTGRTDADDKTDCLLDRTTELCCQTVEKILAHGEPDWEQIDIG